VKLKGGTIGPLQLGAVLRELRRGSGDPRPLGVAGARELVPVLAKQLRAGGDASAVVEQPVGEVAALVWVGPADEARLRAADAAGTRIVAVGEEPAVPYVKATDVVVVRRGEGLPVERVAAAIASALGEDATALAARLPVLRPAVSDHLIASFSRRNALVGAAVFVPGVDMPILTLNQVRLVLRLALAHGQEVDAARAAELLGVVAAGYGWRAVAREALGAVPVAGWAVKGAVAYGGTRAIGEAARRLFSSSSSDEL
jgi:uncharacterized protein (DUF697 family)